MQIYNQTASSFEVMLYLTRDTIVPGDVLIDLADTFVAELLPPGFSPTLLNTRRSVPAAKMNIGPFSTARWKDARQKVLAGVYGALWIGATDSADQRERFIRFVAQVNPTGGREGSGIGRLSVSCSLDVVREIAASAQRVDALLRFGMKAWDGLARGAVYGFANLIHTAKIVPFDPERVNQAEFASLLAPPPLRDTAVHPIPVAERSLNVDGNLEEFYCTGRGIKGAYWANFLSAVYVELAGGDRALREQLTGMRIEPLAAGGLLIVATPSPLPEDTEAYRERFRALYRALQPAFISKANVRSPLKQSLLGYFYREHPNPFS